MIKLKSQIMFGSLFIVSQQVAALNFNAFGVAHVSADQE